MLFVYSQLAMTVLLLSSGRLKEWTFDEIRGKIIFS